MALSEDKLLQATTREAWRMWLERNYRTEKEIWLVFAKKHTGRARVPYNDAVEEALCFGWIDSTVRTIDENSYAQRFTPRRPGSTFSQANLERLRTLVAADKVAEDVLPTLPDLSDESFTIPADILAAIQASREAWKHFQEFSPPYVRIRIAFIEGARKRPAEFEKRLAHFIRMTEQNKQFGFGGIEAHY